ncbi:hypothetical protein HPB51_011874 [Rhipicephalus microplus]|uniref:Transmembrane protein n=1 Tax=Rhipicephalus microplus TaxID=6941 RepID=A0A9J6E923_RHIMP|nr:hypothetical protein HPB51_011874 [Rhipicephalus microplus]
MYWPLKKLFSSSALWRSAGTSLYFQVQLSAKQPPQRGGGLSPRLPKPNSAVPEASKRKSESSKTPPASSQPGSPRAQVQGRQTPGSMSPTPGLMSPTPEAMSPMAGKQSPMSAQRQRRPTISTKDPRLRHFWRSLRSYLRREEEAFSPRRKASQRRFGQAFAETVHGGCLQLQQRGSPPGNDCNQTPVKGPPARRHQRALRPGKFEHNRVHVKAPSPSPSKKAVSPTRSTKARVRRSRSTSRLRKSQTPTGGEFFSSLIHYDTSRSRLAKNSAKKQGSSRQTVLAIAFITVIFALVLIAIVWQIVALFKADPQRGSGAAANKGKTSSRSPHSRARAVAAIAEDYSTLVRDAIDRNADPCRQFLRVCLRILGS